MNLTILHISDLHRDPANPISNVSLLESLERDRERYRQEDPPIEAADLIVVSGDLIQGISQDAHNPEEQLSQQYKQAEEFLGQLANSFVNGDKDRIIIVPGNHDVSFYHAFQSMKRLVFDPATSTTEQAIITKLFLSGHSRLRWSWKEMCFYEISNDNLYQARMDAFCSFYGRFYNSRRSYSLEPESQYDIFSYPNLNVSVAAFSSCYNNDPLNKQAAIHPDCLSAVCRKMRQGDLSPNQLQLAVWHHNTSGGPMLSDYLDAEHLQVLIDNGFSLSFHGHQHKSQFIEERFQFGANRKITIVSAGTLCAGPSELPTGYTRTYNLLQIDTDTYRAKLHIRRMMNESFDTLPIWGKGHLTSTMCSFADFHIQPPIQRTFSSATVSIGKAESLIREKHFIEAIPLLKSLASGNLLARRLLLECYIESDDTKSIVETFYPPSAISEVIYVADALWAEKRQDLLRELISSELVQSSADPSIVEIRQRYEKR